MPIPSETHGHPFVSRAGLKLEHALKEFSFDVNGLVCADFGCNVGGFTDCLLQRGVARVYAIDTGYGTLAYKLRIDPRVVVMERTNALHADPPPSPAGRGAGGEGVPNRNPPIDPRLLDLARQLRHEHTDAERLMWGLLRNRRLLNLKFRRQHPVDPFVLDFYCDELKLAVEIDGGQHNEPGGCQRDAARTRYLAERGIKVLRFWNHEVLRDTTAVLEAICFTAQRDLSVAEAPSPQPSPGGRGSGGSVDLVVIDLAWTPQRHAIPAALRWLAPPPSEGGGEGVGEAADSSLLHDPSAPGAANDSPSPGPSLRGRGVPAARGGHIITLVKPHYEVEGDEKRWLVNGTLSPEHAEQVFQRVLASFSALGVDVLNHCRSPIAGGKSSQKAASSGSSGNVEFLVLTGPTTSAV